MHCHLIEVEADETLPKSLYQRRTCCWSLAHVLPFQVEVAADETLPKSLYPRRTCCWSLAHALPFQVEVAADETLPKSLYQRRTCCWSLAHALPFQVEVAADETLPKSLYQRRTCCWSLAHALPFQVEDETLPKSTQNLVLKSFLHWQPCFFELFLHSKTWGQSGVPCFSTKRWSARCRAEAWGDPPGASGAWLGLPVFVHESFL